MKFMEMTLNQFSDLLGSSEPVPGGGSTAAISGVLATSLTMMVVSLSLGKKSFESLDENIKESLFEEYKNIQNLNKELSQLADEDAKSFNNFMDAMRLPKDTEEEKALRGQKLQEAITYAMETPLTTAEKCFSILKNQKNIALYGNKNAVSDVGVGSLLAMAGLEGALLNVNINLPSIKDEEIKKEAIKKSKALVKDARKLHQEIMEIVNDRIEN